MYYSKKNYNFLFKNAEINKIKNLCKKICDKINILIYCFDNIF